MNRAFGASDDQPEGRGAELRLSGVMEFKVGSVTVADIVKLAEVAGFDDNYLHRRLRRTS